MKSSFSILLIILCALLCGCEIRNTDIQFDNQSINIEQNNRSITESDNNANIIIRTTDLYEAKIAGINFDSIYIICNSEKHQISDNIDTTNIFADKTYTIAEFNYICANKKEISNIIIYYGNNVSKTIYNIPFIANKTTIIEGDFLTSQIDINVKINPNFN